MFNLPDFFKTLKDRFTRNFNRRKECQGTFWSERFKSVLLAPESGVLTKIGAHIDSKPVNFGVVTKAEEYEFSGFGAASRGDKSAIEGIRDLMFPDSTEHGIAYNDAKKAFSEYKKIIGQNGIATPNKKDAKSNQKTTQDYITGAAIGSLKFIAKLAAFVISIPMELHQSVYKPWYNKGDDYYRARRVNKTHRA